MGIRLVSIAFENYKALKKFNLSLKDMNVLVGPNNCGKSTIIGAIRLLEYAVKFANRKNPVYQSTPSIRYAYALPIESLPVSIENIRTDYNDEITKISYRFSNSNTITIEFPDQNNCFMYTNIKGIEARSVSIFKNEFPFKILQVPILGVVESEEELLREETVNKNIGTHRASRNFRNFWYHNLVRFDSFAAMVKETWPGMEVLPPELDYDSNRINMYCQEERIARELFWSGYGFQIWCQLLTYIALSKEVDMLVVDEPDIYLHPELQRKFIEIVRQLESQTVFATHSTELISESEPHEILLIDKKKQSAKRLTDIEGVQEIISNLGSTQNITLSHLARTKRLLFVEGPTDYKIIRKFARKLGNLEISSGSLITAIELGGFTAWEKLGAFAWGYRNAFSQELKIGVIFDRDYFCDEEIESIQSELKKNSIPFVFHHDAKEIENLLIIPTVIERIVVLGINDRNQKTGESVKYSDSILSIINDISTPMKSEILGQHIAKRSAFYKASGKDNSTITKETIEWFDKKWNSIDSRISLLPGKETLHKIRDYIQDKYRISISDSKIIDFMKKEEIPTEIRSIISWLKHFAED